MSKNKIIKIIIIALIIVCAIFLVNLGRKTYILCKCSKEASKYADITNFYKKTSPEDGVISELWRKGNLGFLKRTSKEDVKMIYYGEDYDWIIVDGKDSKTAVKMEKNMAGIEVNALNANSLDMPSLWDKIKVACLAKITTEKLNNKECYKIVLNKDYKIFIGKDDGLVAREINGSTDTGFIEYKINEVRDEDVLMPNLAGYTIIDKTEK